MSHQRSQRGEFWVRTRRTWDLFFYVCLVIVAVATLVTPGTRVSTVGSLACLVALGLAYTFVGRRAAAHGSRRLALLYVALLVPLTITQIGFDNLGGVLLFVAYSHIWFFSEHRWQGVVWATVVTAGVAVRFVLLARASGEPTLPVVGQMSVSLLFAIVLGLWVTQIAELSEERAALVEQLEAAQAELATTHHAAGVVAERERMAQEIHDTLAQGFTSVVMLAQTSAAELDRGRAMAARERVTQIELVARQNLAEARALVAAFGPADLQDATLGEALTRLAERFTAQASVRVDLAAGTTAAATGLSRDTQVALLRAAQESLANVRKHAGASHVTIGLEREGDDVRLVVVDDGKGLPADAAEGAGLRGMRERARTGGGELEVGRAPGAGTRVALRLPAGVGSPVGSGPLPDEGGEE